MKVKWYTKGKYDKIKCGNCEAEFQNIQAMDHHPRICPKCQIECIWYDLGEKEVLQIIPKFAPDVFVQFIKWSQKELDELEFSELLVHLTELGQVTNWS